MAEEENKEELTNIDEIELNDDATMPENEDGTSMFFNESIEDVQNEIEEPCDENADESSMPENEDGTSMFFSESVEDVQSELVDPKQPEDNDISNNNNQEEKNKKSFSSILLIVAVTLIIILATIGVLYYLKYPPFDKMFKKEQKVEKIEKFIFDPSLVDKKSINRQLSLLTRYEINLDELNKTNNQINNFETVTIIQIALLREKTNQAFINNIAKNTTQKLYICKESRMKKLIAIPNEKNINKEIKNIKKTVKDAYISTLRQRYIKTYCKKL